MKIKLKPLKDKEFSIDDVSEDMTVAELKQRIEKDTEEKFKADATRLILSGKVLKDDRILKDLKLTEKSFFVVLPAKTKKKPEPAPTPKAEVKTQAAVTQPAAAQPAVPAPATSLVTPEGLKALTDMGFTEADAQVALAAAFGSIERAAEYLMDPSKMPPPEVMLPPPTTAPPNPNMNPLQAFRNSPDFAALKQTLENDPSQVQAIIQGMQTSHPALFAYVSSDQQHMGEFIDLLSGDDDVPTTPGGIVNPFAASAGAAGGGQGIPELDPQNLAAMLRLFQSMPENQRAEILNRYGLPPDAFNGLDQLLEGGGGAIPVPEATTELTAEDRAKIDNMVGMGFPRNACIEAYIVCEKNQEAAINLLLTTPPEPDLMEQDDGVPPPRNPNNNSGGGNSEEDI